MKLWLLLLFMPMAYAQIKAPGCSELPGIVKQLEKDLMSKHFQTSQCNEIDARADLTTPTEAQVKLIADYKCSSLGSIETLIKQKENEIAFLEGFEKLKNDIKVSKEKAGAASLPVAQQAGISYQDSLIVAQSLEVLINSSNSDGTLSLMKDLKKVPLEKRKTLSQFNAELKKICAARKVPATEAAQDACKDGAFTPNDVAVNELNSLIEKSAMTDQQQVDWMNALSIKKTDATPYNFSSLRQDMRDALIKVQDNKLELSRAELKAIRQLPDFENAAGLNFLNNLKSAKNRASPQVSSQEFQFLVGDLKKRQEYEIQSKVSLAWDEFKEGAGDDAAGSCKNATTEFANAVKCITVLEAAIPGAEGLSQAQLKEMVDAIKIANSYQESLVGVETTCLPKNYDPDKAVTPSCHKLLSGDLAALQQEVAAMTVLKNKVVGENQELLTFRNFAVDKLKKNCSPQEMETNVECSEAFTSKISKEATAITAEGLDILLVYAKPSEEIDVKALCDAGKNPKVHKKAALCAFLTDTVSDEVPADPKPKKDDDYVAPTTAGSRNHVTDALANALGNFARVMYPPQTSTFNPYQTAAPYSPIGPGVSLSSAIIMGSGVTNPMVNGDGMVGRYYNSTSFSSQAFSHK